MSYIGERGKIVDPRVEATMTVESSIKTAEAQAATVVTTAEADVVIAETFFQKYKPVIIPVVSAIVGLIVGHKL